MWWKWGFLGILFDAATKIEHDTVHMLSRDEVARYGIDATSFRESRWTMDEGRPRSRSILKFVTEAKGPNEFRTSVVRLACENASVLRIAYIRGLASADAPGPTSIRIVAGERSVAFPRIGVRSTINALDNGGMFETRRGRRDIHVLRSGRDRPEHRDYRSAGDCNAGTSTARGEARDRRAAQALRALRSICSRD